MGSPLIIWRLALAAVMMLSTSIVAEARVANTSRAYAAAHYLTEQQSEDGSIAGFSPVGSTADAIVSMVAVRPATGPLRRALRFLKENIAEADTVGLKAKVALAAIAAGKDPSDFGGTDLIAAIAASQQADGSYGGESFAEVFDHALAMLALSAAEGVPESNDPAGAVGWLLAAQCADGGWQFDEPAAETDDEHCVDASNPEDFDSSNTDATALAVQALVANSALAQTSGDPFAFFTARRDPVKNGWGYDAGFALTNANSTALVLQAYAAAEQPAPEGSVRALKGLQYKPCGAHSGAFAFTWESTEDGYARTDPDVGATIGGILGLLRTPLPVTHPIVGVSDPCS